MNKLLKKASARPSIIGVNKYEIFSLTENPFPTMASVNENSPEKKYNGSIYEESIREEEYRKLLGSFLQIPQTNPDHLRLGFLSDTSYVGRGNGKTSFLVNLMRIINREYSLDISDGNNKCFSVYFFPDGGGSVKSFERFVDYFFSAILKSNVINESIALLRYEAISALGWNDVIPEEEFPTGEAMVQKLTDDDWFRKNVRHYKREVTEQLLKNPDLGALPADFPIYKDLTALSKLISQNDFEKFYKDLRGEKLKLDFVFTHLVSFFLAAGFNGSYVLIDDFERIPDFQSAMQKKDFAIQLRTVLFDGGYLNSKIGFYNFIIALHAGVPRLIQEAWSLAGMEQRVAISGSNGGQNRHIINFEKINDKHAIKLIKKYLNEYRTTGFSKDELYPFNAKSITLIANKAEMNISRILQSANNILEYAIEHSVREINDDFLQTFFSKDGMAEVDDEPKVIANTVSIDLSSKIKTK